MDFAVIQTSGTQYKVSEGEKIEIDRIDKKEGEKVEFPEVLLVAKDGEITLGKPFVKKCKAAAEVVNHHKGEKIRIATYKAKSRYRKVKGYRHQYTTVLIKEIKYGKN